MSVLHAPLTKLQVRVEGSSREFVEPSARLGRLAFRRTEEGWILLDMGVQGGLFLDGCRVERLAIPAGRSVTIGVGEPGGPSLELEVCDDTPPAPAPPPAVLIADDVSVLSPDGRTLVDRARFGLAAGSLTAVIGPSGAGKSTLLRVLSGQTAPDRGRVRWAGHDLVADRDRLRSRIGVVPQDDILHPQLTVQQGLEYAALLRLPGQTTELERALTVDAVVDRMGLTAHRHQRIGTELSGGQRKRVSIATELLTAPPLLILDEPTSGLDPGLDLAVMQQLHGLAEEGRVVVVATHSLLGLEVCDTVVVLGRGGRVLYVGPPDGLLAAFGCVDHPELFTALESDLAPVTALPTPVATPAPPEPLPEPPSHSGPRQFATLVRRNLAVIRADRFGLALMMLMPLLLAGLSRVVQGDAGLSLAATRIAGQGVDAAEAGQRLTVLIVAAALIGMAMTVRELVKERAVLRREYAVGLSPGLYFASKVLVLATICALQGAVVTWLALVGLPGPDRGGILGWGHLEVAVPIGALAAATAVIGLTVSALVRSVEQTMPSLVAVVMAQLVLSGALVQVLGRPVLEQVAWLAPARWAHAAAAASVNLERAKRRVVGAEPDPLYEATLSQWGTNLAVLALLALVIGLVGLRAVRRGL